MIVLKNKSEITLMREAGRISAQALICGGEAVRPGVSTRHIDKIIHDYIRSQGATPSFLG
ncbi:MAG: M24 family metallopeptidase, partial [Oscillospiraceae bacterium]